jgi:hypothetical protein
MSSSYDESPYPYLKTPNYVEYIKILNHNLKSGPYYTFNQEKTLPIMYNYVDPVLPYLKPECHISPRYQYWFTPQE